MQLTGKKVICIPGVDVFCFEVEKCLLANYS